MQPETQPTPWRIFISSTYEDMLPYREAVSDALTSIEHLPIGMEQFVVLLPCIWRKTVECNSPYSLHRNGFREHSGTAGTRTEPAKRKK